MELTRLGRNLGDLIAIEKELYKKGVKLRVITQPIDTSTSTGRLDLPTSSATVAQFERELSWERTVHGLKSAVARGVLGGQPSEYSDVQIRGRAEKGERATQRKQPN